MPEATEAAFRDEWFYTGDLGYKDDEGYFFIVGRKKEMIICGGYNVYPREIEELLVTHPGILEAAVIGIHDREKGEVPKAFIVPKAGSKLCEADIISFCKENLAAYKLPRVIEFLVELPKTSTGKILKRELK
jgi:long-chain acyl-CoA synthetase